MRLATPDDAIFELDGDRLVPCELAQGPWDPDGQHGGAVCALLARAVERCDTPESMRVARISFDLMRQVPLRPLASVARVRKSGRRAQLVDASLFEGELEVACTRALLIRRDEGLGIDAATRGLDALPVLERREGAGVRFVRRDFGSVPGWIGAVDLERMSVPRAGERAVAWTRLRCPVVAGEETTPLVRLAALADFASGMANALDFARFVAINPDLTLHVLREPAGEWIGLDCETALGDDGIGQSSADIHDETGLVARVQTSLFVDRR